MYQDKEFPPLRAEMTEENFVKAPSGPPAFAFARNPVSAGAV